MAEVWVPEAAAPAEVLSAAEVHPARRARLSTAAAAVISLFFRLIFFMMVVSFLYRSRWGVCPVFWITDYRIRRAVFETGVSRKIFLFLFPFPGWPLAFPNC